MTDIHVRPLLLVCILMSIASSMIWVVSLIIRGPTFAPAATDYEFEGTIGRPLYAPSSNLLSATLVMAFLWLWYIKPATNRKTATERTMMPIRSPAVDVDAFSSAVGIVVGCVGIADGIIVGTIVQTLVVVPMNESDDTDALEL